MSTNDLQEIAFNENMFRDPLHTDHTKGGEVYFLFLMNVLSVYDLFEGDW